MPTRTQLKRAVKDAVIISLPMRVSIHDINLDMVARNVLDAIEKICLIVDMNTRYSIEDEDEEIKRIESEKTK